MTRLCLRRTRRRPAIFLTLLEIKRGRKKTTEKQSSQDWLDSEFTVSGRRLSGPIACRRRRRRRRRSRRQAQLEKRKGCGGRVDETTVWPGTRTAGPVLFGLASLFRSLSRYDRPSTAIRLIVTRRPTSRCRSLARPPARSLSLYIHRLSLSSPRAGLKSNLAEELQLHRSQSRHVELRVLG